MLEKVYVLSKEENKGSRAEQTSTCKNVHNMHAHVHTHAIYMYMCNAAI